MANLQKRRKVLFIVGTLHAGGIERSVADWCNYLLNYTDWEPEVVCLLKRNGIFLQNLEKHGVKVHECRLSENFFVLRFSALLRKVKPDVLHSQVAFSMPWQVIAAISAGVRKIIFTQQNDYKNWDLFWSNLRLRLYFSMFLPFISHYTCVSQQVKDNLCQMTGMSASRFQVVPNGVNIERFKPNKAIYLEVRKNLGFSHDTFLLGMVGRFSPQKGHIFLLEALQRIPANIHLKVLLIGAGELKSELEAYVKQHELGHRVIFYGTTFDVQDVLPGLDAFILSSLWEGMPLALLEAMACGLPVIGTEVAGTKEVIRHRENGLLIPPGDPESIKHAIIYLKENSEAAAKMGESALRTIQEHYSVARNVNEYIKLYES